MAHQSVEQPGDDVSLRPYFRAVWRFRQVIGAALAVVAVLFVIAAAALSMWLPKERLGIVEFRLLFRGAEENRYPNGTPFNAAEIVAAPVLSRVYELNDLKRFCSLAQLQESMFVLQSNFALQQLAYEYQAKLSDARLSPVDRARLEDEFRRKREAIRDPAFSLTLRRTERLGEMPAELMAKTLTDTLAEWAQQADTQKGAARPDIAVIPGELFTRAHRDSDGVLIRIDVLRSGAQRILGALEALGEVPGAHAVRSDTKRALADEQATIENILKFDIEPLMGLARLTASNDADRVLLQAYLSNQLVTYRLQLRQAVSRAQNLQTSLREYMAQRGSRVEDAGPPPGEASGPRGGTINPQVMPQFNDSFIDRLMEMSAATQGKELEYRQDLTDRFIAASEEAVRFEREIGYYEDLLKQLTAPVPAVGMGTLSQTLSTRFEAVLGALNTSLGDVQNLYDEISRQTLNPTRMLYSDTQPFRLERRSFLPWRTVVLAFGLTMLATLIVAVTVVLVRHPPTVEPRVARHAA